MLPCPQDDFYTSRTERDREAFGDFVVSSWKVRKTIESFMWPTSPKDNIP